MSKRHVMRLGENRRLAEWYLDRVDPSRLAGHEQKVWLALIRELKPAPFVLERLIKLRESGRMTPELAHIWPTKPRSWATPN